MQWGDLQNIETVGALNDMVTKYDMREIVLVQEAYQERQIAQIAAQIAAKPETKLVMIAGPSSSGKTTFSHRLSIQLRTQGMRPHPIAVDNYFVDREKHPGMRMAITILNVWRPLTSSSSIRICRHF